MSLNSKERAALRGEAHHLVALVHIGHHGLTPSVIKSLDDALRTHELVKVQLGRPVDIDTKDAARDLAESVDAEVVQVIGKTVTLFRENPELERKKGAAPPWKK